ncbi:MAG: HNH endonuclease [Fimbriimonadaceae bacterium]
MSAKSRLREYFLAHVGKVLTSQQLQKAAGEGVTEWARRVREIRDEEGWPIVTHNDTTDLKPGQYMLVKLPKSKDVSFGRGISAKLRAQVLDRNGFTCQMCGMTPGDIDPQTGRTVRLHIGHIKDKSLGGKDELANLRALCSTCNQGAKNVTAEKPSDHWLISKIRRAGQAEQRRVYEWLRKKFGE